MHNFKTHFIRQRGQKRNKLSYHRILAKIHLNKRKMEKFNSIKDTNKSNNEQYILKMA